MCACACDVTCLVIRGCHIGGGGFVSCRCMRVLVADFVVAGGGEAKWRMGGGAIIFELINETHADLIPECFCRTTLEKQLMFFLLLAGCHWQQQPHFSTLLFHLSHSISLHQNHDDGDGGGEMAMTASNKSKRKKTKTL